MDGKLQEKKRFERRWGWLANLASGLIMTGFQILRNYFKFIFNSLSRGPEGFFFLIILHLFAILALAQAL